MYKKSTPSAKAKPSLARKNAKAKQRERKSGMMGLNAPMVKMREGEKAGIVKPLPATSRTKYKGPKTYGKAKKYKR
jgi:hypothetical protein